MIQSKIIGLTGGIASGKSTVSKYLSDKGIPIVDADIVARQVVQPGSKGLKEIVSAFGEDLLLEGQLNRKKLRDIIFSDDEKRLLLNSILHPIIHDEIENQIQSYVSKHELVVFDAPLLLENDLKHMVDVLWLVSCSEEKQIQRVMTRDSISEVEAKNIIGKQMPLKEKEGLADLVIVNESSLDDLYEQVDTALEEL